MGQKICERNFRNFGTFLIDVIPNVNQIDRTVKRPVYIFAFGEYNSKQVNVSGIQSFPVQF